MDSAVFFMRGHLILVDELNAHRNLTDLSLAEPGRPLAYLLHTHYVSLAGLELGRLLRGSMWPAFGPALWTTMDPKAPKAPTPHRTSCAHQQKKKKDQQGSGVRSEVTQGRLLPSSVRSFQTRWDFAPAAAAARAAGSQGLGLGS